MGVGRVIKIEIPKFEMILKYDELDKIPASKAGVYVIYGEYNEVMYTGKAEELRSRIHNHFTGNTNTGLIYQYFYKVGFFYEDDPVYRDMYETYIINKFESKWNEFKCFTFKSYRDIYRFKRIPKFQRWERKVHTKNRCNHIKDNGEQCKRYVVVNEKYCNSHLKMHV